MLARRLGSCAAMRPRFARPLSAKVLPDVQPVLHRRSVAFFPHAQRRTASDSERAPAGRCRRLTQGCSAKEPVNVVLLSGFLGAGKTTVLEQLLKEKHGFKLGVLVNDLASVNVDANVLRKTIEASRVQSISLENGCVCCTASEDLQQNVNQLVQTQPKLDAVVVEMSGVAEPARAKKILETEGRTDWWQQDRPLSVRTVTVVDSPAFPTDYLKEQTNHTSHKHAEGGECDERFGGLLAEQVESADMILLNKADMATEAEILQTQAMVQALNEAADTQITTYGRVEVTELLGALAKQPLDTDMEAARMVEPAPPARKVSACCVKKTCSKTNKQSATICSEDSGKQDTRSRAEKRFGITSFVYTTDRLMSRSKLVPHLERWQRARANLGDRLSLEGLGGGDDVARAGPVTAVGVDSPLLPVLRSKGMVYLDAKPDIAFYWSHAGRSVAFLPFGPWPSGFSPPRTELVFIGAGQDERAIRDLLDSCLLTDEELIFFAKLMGKAPEPKASSPAA